MFMSMHAKLDLFSYDLCSTYISYQSALLLKGRPSAGASHMSGVWGKENRGKPFPRKI